MKEVKEEMIDLALGPVTVLYGDGDAWTPHYYQQYREDNYLDVVEKVDHPISTQMVEPVYSHGFKVIQ